MQAKIQLIAHDKEVFDVAFVGANPDIFASVGADPPEGGSLRMFDKRNLDHSTIMYETNTPLVRLSWNATDPNYVATFSVDSNRVAVIDIRSPQKAMVELNGHDAGNQTITRVVAYFVFTRRNDERKSPSQPTKNSIGIADHGTLFHP
jgi:WD repeat-containing protein 68